jgi:hypothetical protein
MNRRFSALGLFLVFAVTACVSGGGGTPGDEEDLSKCTASSPRSIPIQLSVWPEAGEAALTDVLAKANRSIRLMVYMLGQDAVFETLKAKAQAGKDVRVILDGGKQRHFNTPAFDALTAAGVKVKWSDPKFAFMHAKSFVVDDAVAIISTGNFPKNLIGDERNYVWQRTRIRTTSQRSRRCSTPIGMGKSRIWHARGS